MKTFYSFLLLLFSCFSFCQTIQLTSFVTGLNNPVEIVHAGDSRLFIVEQGGIIKILNANGTVNTTPFLDIDSSVGSGGERGLLGLAFAPDYTTSGRFYVNYTNNSGNTVIARYTVSNNPDIANTSGTVLLTINQPFSNHNGGKIAFGTDGFLYISTGDGGSGGDPGNRSQNTNNLLGKLLRIDVSGSTYTNPTTNPYVSGGGAGEVYAIGLRNTWKFSFDRTTGDIWTADVGQNAIEEINLVPGSGTPGDNYGWRCYEGNSNFNVESSCPLLSATITPVSQYTHGNSRCSITGGYIYRGSQYPAFTGKYFYADFCSNEIGILTNNNGTWSNAWQLPTPNSSWTSFGEDNSGELYVVGGNAVYKISDANLSVNEETLNGFKLYPNPANNEVTIDFGSNFSNIESLSIVNIQGQKITNFNTIEVSKINISTETYANGVYFVKINTFNGRKIVKKLVLN